MAERPGIDQPVTPHAKGKHVSGKSIEHFMRPFPKGFKVDFTELNPHQKSFSNARVDHAQDYFPVKPFGRRMVSRDFVGGEDAMGSGSVPGGYHADGIPAKKTPKATVRAKS